MPWIPEKAGATSPASDASVTPIAPGAESPVRGKWVSAAALPEPSLAVPPIDPVADPSARMPDRVNITEEDLQLNLEQFKGMNPDAVAWFNRIATGRGIDIETVRHNEQDFKNYEDAKNLLDRVGQINPDGSYRYPKLMRWMLYPENLAMSKDDAPALSTMEGLFSSDALLQEEINRANSAALNQSPRKQTEDDRRNTVRRILDLQQVTGETAPAVPDEAQLALMREREALQTELKDARSDLFVSWPVVGNSEVAAKWKRLRELNDSLVPDQQGGSSLKLPDAPIDQVENAQNFLSRLPERQKQLDELRARFTPEEFQRYESDIRKMDWTKNKDGYAKLSDGAFRFSPEALQDRAVFTAALDQAVTAGEMDEAGRKRALDTFAVIEERNKAAQLEVAKRTTSFQMFRARPENDNLTEREVFDRYTADFGVSDWIKGQARAVVGGAVSYTQSIAAGVLLKASGVLNADEEGAAAEYARLISQSMAQVPESGDVRTAGTTGSTIGQFIPQLLIAGAVTVATRNAKAGLTAFAVEQLTQGYTAGLQIGAESYQTVYAENVGKYGGERAHQMAMEAFTNSLPVGFTENIPIERILSKLPKGKLMAFMKLATDSATEVGQEWAQNQLSNAINQNASAAYVQPQHMSLQEAMEMGLGTFVLSGGRHAGEHLVGQGQRWLSDRAARSEQAQTQAQTDRQTIDAMGEAAKGSKLLQRAPEKFEEAIQEMKAGTGLENVYIPADKFSEYFQSQGIDPEQMARELGVSDQLPEAGVTGGDLVIPAEKYLSKIAATEHHAGLSNDLRLRLGASTQREADETGKATIQQLHEAFQITRETAESTKKNTGETVYQDVRSQFLKAGLKETEAHENAVLYRSFFETLQSDTGADVGELYKQLGLKIQAVKTPESTSEKTEESTTVTAPSSPDEVFQGSRDEINLDDAYSKLANEAIVGNRTFNTPIPLGKTPAVLQALGVKNLPIVIDQNTLNKARTKHEVTIEDLKQLPKEIRDPVMIFDSKTSGLNILTSFRNAKGEVVAAAIHLEKAVGRGFVVHDIATVSQRNIGQLQEWLNSGLLRYVDTKRAADLSVKSGLQLPTPESDQPLKAKVLTREDVVNRFGELFQGAGTPRGSVKFAKGKTILSLFEGRDKSTAPHEAAHIFLNLYAQAAASPEASDRLRANWEATLKWLGVKEASEIERPHHEKFAEGFEAYLLEGKAPSEELRTTFQRFKRWLLALYRSVAGSIKVAPEVRDIFNRMLATDEQIAAIERENDFIPAFTSRKESGLTSAEYDDYVKLTETAQNNARDTLLAKVMKEQRQRLSKEYKEERETLRGEAETNVDDRGIYQTIQFFRDGTMVGRTVPKKLRGLKLPRPEIVERFGQRLVDQITGKHTSLFTHAKEGVGLEALAEMLGYDSGEKMLREIADAPSRTDAVEAEMDRLMTERHPGMLTDLNVREAALAAVFSEERFNLLAAELRGLARLGGTNAPPASEIKRYAVDLISQKKVAEIQPGQYLSASYRAANRAQTAIGNKKWSDASKAKQEQLLNYQLYREALRAQEEVERIVRYMRRFEKDTVRAELGKAGSDYLEQIDYLMDRYDFRTSTTLTQIARNHSLLEFVARQEKEGNPVDIDPEILSDAARVSYKEVPFSHLQNLHNAVKNIEHLARLKNDLAHRLYGREFEAAVGDFVGSVNSHTAEPTNKGLREPGWQKDRDFKASLGAALRSINASHLKMEFIAEMMDGFEKFGPVWSMIFKPIADAEATEAAKMRALTEGLARIFDRHSKKERAEWFSRKMNFPAQNISLNKASILALALNWGNDGNRDAVMNGYNWSQQDVRQILDVLEKKDWDTVQSIWDLVNSLWPDITQLQREMTGLVPEKVEASPFQTKYGIYSGGYYPLSFDRTMDQRVAEAKAAENADSLFETNFIRPATRKGHTIERVGSGGRPVALDLSVLTQHLQNVVHDLTHRQTILAIDKVTRDERVVEAVRERYGDEIYNQIRPWLQNIARPQREPLDYVDKAFRRLRVGGTIVNMGLKISTAIVQPLGIVQTAEILGPKWTALGLFDFYLNPAKWAENVQFVMQRSEQMRNRMDTFDRDVRELFNEPKGVVSSALEKKKLLILTAIMDMLIALPSWWGGYHRGLKEFKGNEAKAIAYADNVVRTSQAAGGAKDLAQIQRGGEKAKIFTMFYSFLNLLYNLLYRRAVIQARGGVKELPRTLLSALSLLVISPLLAELAAGRGPDDDEDWKVWAAKKAVMTPFSTVVGVRELASALFDGYDYEITPVAGFGKAVYRLGNQLQQGEVDKPLVRAASDLVGYTFAVPSKQAWITGSYLYDVSTGEEDEFSLRDLLFARQKK